MKIPRVCYWAQNPYLPR